MGNNSRLATFAPLPTEFHTISMMKISSCQQNKSPSRGLQTCVDMMLCRYQTERTCNKAACSVLKKIHLSACIVHNPTENARLFIRIHRICGRSCSRARPVHFHFYSAPSNLPSWCSEHNFRVDLYQFLLLKAVARGRSILVSTT